MKPQAIAIVLVLMLISATAYAADDKPAQSRTPISTVPYEGYQKAPDVQSAVPAELEEAMKIAMESGNIAEQRRIGDAIRALLPPQTLRKSTADADAQPAMTPAVFSPEWYANDIRVHTGNLQYHGYRQLDLKKGEDGNLYLGVNCYGVTSYTGYIYVYKSTNGGLTWSGVSGVTSPTAYFGEFSMLIESKNASILDSTRITILYTRSASSTMSGAAVRYASFLRNGSAWYGGTDIETPPSGHMFGSPSAFSDGMYFSSGTYLGVVAAEYNTNRDTSFGIYLWRSTDWGVTWTGAKFNTGYQDFNPTVFLKPGTAYTLDSAYIAVERRFSTSTLVRVLATKFNPPTASWNSYYLPPTSTGDIYQKPFINVRQTARAYGSSRDMLITVVKNGGAVYHESTNGGVSWNYDYDLDMGVRTNYTFCASDTLTAGGGCYIAAYTNTGGDTVGVRRGVLGFLGTRVYRNSKQASLSVGPSCAIYRNGTTKLSAYAYPGYGPTDVWFNQESLVGAVEKTTEEPTVFRLDQNFPNPFNPATTISFAVPKRSNVSLKVYDLMGREVATLVEDNLEPGGYQTAFDGSRFASGVYVYRLTAGQSTFSRKMVLTK